MNDVLTRHPGGRMRAILVTLMAVLLALAMLPLAAGAAKAHDQLISSTPANGERLEQAPSEAVFEFSDSPMEIGNEFALVNDADGSAIALTTAATVSGTHITQPLPELPAGSFTLNWRVVSSDGHPIAGAVQFGVQQEVAGGASTSPGTPATQERPAASAEVPSAVTQPATTPASTSAPAIDPPLAIALGIVALLIVAGTGVAFWARLKRAAGRNPELKSHNTDPKGPVA